MCVVSMVSDHYMQRWPTFPAFPVLEYENFNELMRKARLYDEMTKQADCQKAEKALWQKGLEDFMRSKYGLEPLLDDSRTTTTDSRPAAGSNP